MLLSNLLFLKAPSPIGNDSDLVLLKKVGTVKKCNNNLHMNYLVKVEEVLQKDRKKDSDSVL